ncbi:bifunctional riboflavin kinase/FAD synthetase [uncultured Winogradskyella sp.]|uniref:bifunctional riboflavin kinase/FAD synthetase n=1 Tax=uncultured Winogradskyella sp. TaxID=395353 RepID=UPI003512C7E5
MAKKSVKVTTIGTFDGVHIGHQKILNRVIKLADSQGYESAVLTLFPHPRMVLFGDGSIKLINTIDERIEILKSFGINHVIVKTFTKRFANLSAEDYVKTILVDELNTKQIVIGYDHHFGKGRSANISDLKVFAKMFDFKVEEISAQDIKDVTVSSTKIRNALQEGHVDKANTYLGYHFFVTGSVVKGNKIGRTIGFPTANIFIKDAYKLIPKDGVYVVRSRFKNRTLTGMLNIGNKPTVDGNSKSIEVHFFNFNEDLYGKTLKIEFLKRLRDERKFEGLDTLKSQLQLDMKEAQSFITKYDN